MSEELTNIKGRPILKHLNNIGGPRSRQRSEDIKADFLYRTNTMTDAGVYSVIIPQTNDIENWLLGLGRSVGLNGWEEICTKINLPSEKLMVIAIEDDDENNHQTVFEKLRNAIVLSKSNQLEYRPDFPMIFTRNRMNRRISLINLKISRFYDLD